MNSENSALTALSELRNLEAGRVAKEEAEQRAQDEAQRRAREEADLRARQQAEQVAKAEADRLAQEQAARDAREREERIRVQETEARARAEQEARLREEQMRIDAQMRIAEQKAKPKWPLVVVPLLALSVCFAGYLAYDSHRQGEEQAQRDALERQRLEEEKAKTDAALVAIQAKLSQLESEQQQLESQRQALDAKLQDVRTDAAERARLQAERDALDGKLVENKKAQTVTRKRKSKPRKKPSNDAATEKADAPVGGSTKRKESERINLGDGDDPLSGL